MSSKTKISDTSGQDVVLKPGSSKYKVVGAMAVVVILAASAWLGLPIVQRWSQAQISVSAERLRFADVARGDFVRDVSVQGRVVAAVSPTLYATQSGTITFEVESGDSVHKQQLLASIESPEIENRLLQEQSRLTSLRIEYPLVRVTAATR